jgi:hypothetical protein
MSQKETELVERFKAETLKKFRKAWSGQAFTDTNEVSESAICEAIDKLHACLSGIEKPPRELGRFGDSHDYAHAMGEHFVRDTFYANLGKLLEDK